MTPEEIAALKKELTPVISKAQFLESLEILQKSIGLSDAETTEMGNNLLRSGSVVISNIEEEEEAEMEAPDAYFLDDPLMALAKRIAKEYASRVSDTEIPKSLVRKMKENGEIKTEAEMFETLESFLTISKLIKDPTAAPEIHENITFRRYIVPSE